MMIENTSYFLTACRATQLCFVDDVDGIAVFDFVDQSAYKKI